MQPTETGLCLAAAWVKSSGVFRLRSTSQCARRGLNRLARSVFASDWSEKFRAPSAASTAAKPVTRSNAKGKPTPAPDSTNTPLPFRCATARIRSGVTNGMSHERNRSRSARLRRSAVHTPPNGPQRGMRSRRMTRTGQPVARAAARTHASNERPRSRSRALSRPIRSLSPPARMTISTVGGCPLPAARCPLTEPSP